MTTTHPQHSIRPATLTRMSHHDAPAGPAEPVHPVEFAEPDAAQPGPSAAGMGQALRPLAIDLALPLAMYYLLSTGFGCSVWVSLALSSIVPAARSLASVVIQREANLLAALMLVVNVASIGVSFLTGDPRMMIAKDAVISSVIGFAILISVGLRRPLMSAGLKPFMTRGDAGRAAAWDRLSAGSARFRRLEMLFSAIWGVCGLADCVLRVIGAFTLPVSTMVWLSTVLLIGSIVVAAVVSGTASNPISRMLDQETA